MELIKTFMEERGIEAFDFPPELLQEEAAEEIIYNWREDKEFEDE